MAIMVLPKEVVPPGAPTDALAPVPPYPIVTVVTVGLSTRALTYSPDIPPPPQAALAELEAEPVSQAYNLAELIEGMEVSIDVSTCDADLGNRYFGTVTEALELDTAKNGHILLVQDAEPNFDVNGNSPVTPDAWISCSERMPNDAQWCVVDAEGGYYVQCWSEGQGWLGDDISLRDCDVIRWMPLPEPPQEMK
ncbi:DUF551 domain-containing protein [Escherichia coli]|uniref:DUF551 domain-containing protein n=1 Tax=Escherichia coli TaxID=562 RepID=UPI001E337AC5|nr:DUF551 domain-containing protein [Escherichia coli]MCA8642031.1 DUF551 domain-containing protein [Escherichia coli]MCD6886906.1 DUF551 domain-containing protein [Escherichia coli]MDI7118801.1 DUF551 domain-containing protein [Escherichia coli]